MQRPLIILLAALVSGSVLPACESSTDLDGNGAGEHTEIVNRLVDVVSADSELKGRIEEHLAEQDEGSFWHGKDLQFLYRYFDEWLTFLPTPADARKYMDPFYELTASEEGRAIVQDERGGSGPLRLWRLRHHPPL